MTTTNSVTTDNADLITYHAARIGQPPPMYCDLLTGKIVTEVSTESREAFLNDAPLQRFLSVKKTIWRKISELRNRGRI